MIAQITLTKSQLKILAPLFEMAEQEARNGRKGSILAQPFANDGLGRWPGKMNCAFIEMERAQAVDNALKRRIRRAKK